ncbi:MAG TPA: CCA tRNA nucleotidyltransferase [Clostridia bacterium]|nr:CCA tRNA nucleotidyltransferase [Clostridia bacterium]
MADYIYTMEIRLTPDQMKGVTLVQDAARAHGFNVYLSGGAIRDILTGFPIRDLDFSVQGNPLKMQKDLERAGARVDGVDEESRELHLILPGNVRAEVSMTRAETYDKPGKPPVVTPATINEDLRRRDFTVNAMALSLNPGSRGLLLDPFNGSADIEAKVIRILHNYAFLEEPSRLIRASRFCARFHWELEERTRARYESAKEGDYIQYIRKENIGYEIEQVAHEEDPLSIIKALEREGWLKVLDANWAIAKIDTAGLQALMKTRQTMLDFGISVDAAPAVMHFATSKLPPKDVADIQRILPHREFVNAWKHLDDEAKELAKKLQGKEASTPSGAWKILSEAKPEALLYLEVTGKNKAVDEKIKSFFGKWRQVQQKLPLPEMAEMRITPQLPEYPRIAHEAFLLLLDGKLRSHTEIVKFLEPHSPPPPPPPPPPPARRGRGAKAEAKKVHQTAAPATHAEQAPAVAGEKPKKGAPLPTKAAPEAPKAKPPAPQVKVETRAAAKAVAKAEAKAVKPPAKAAAKAPAKPALKQAKAPVKAPAKAVAKAPAKVAKPAPRKAVAKPVAKPLAKKAAKRGR